MTLVGCPRLVGYPRCWHRTNPKGGVHSAGDDGHHLARPPLRVDDADEFGKSIEPKWQVASQLVENVRFAVEKKQLTPLDGARVISAIAATLFGYDEFILREISSETLLAAGSPRR
jgi:hypothetical protein